MVRIKKGNHTLSVTWGAFFSLYESMGYAITETEGDEAVPPVSDKAVPQSEPKNGSEDDSDPVDDDDGVPVDDGYDDEDPDLEEKPLSEMDFKELKEYASRLGIRTNGMNSKKDLRVAIRQVQDQQ